MTGLRNTAVVRVFWVVLAMGGCGSSSGPGDDVDAGAGGAGGEGQGGGPLAGAGGGANVDAYADSGPSQLVDGGLPGDAQQASDAPSLPSDSAVTVPDSALEPDVAVQPVDTGSEPPEPDAMAEMPQADAGEEADANTPPINDPGTVIGMCNATMRSHPSEGTVHVQLCSNIVYKTNPPNSGNHYGAWAAYRTYSRPIPWGFLVHSLEHGAIVITYNCPEGCAQEVAEVQAFIDGLPSDCGGGVKRRVILMPEPNLDVRFAASAWRHTLKADCFDPQAFRRFFDERYNKGREDSCNQGTDPTRESTGGTPLCGL